MEKKQIKNNSMVIYYAKRKSFLGFYITWLIFGCVIFMFSFGIINVLLNSLLISLVIAISLTIIYWLYQANELYTIELSNDGVLIEFPFSLIKKKIALEYSEIICLYFHCGPFGRNTPGVFVKFKLNNKIKKMGFIESTPSVIEDLLNKVSLHGVKTGISNNSVNFLGLKDRLRIINTE